jgi:hypothetical protein
MTTIGTSTTTGITLEPPFYTSPVVINAGVTITNPGYPAAVYTAAGNTVFFAVENNRTITGSGPYDSSVGGVGVYLAPGGSVTNAASASITGYTGVKIFVGAGTVVNLGSIVGSETVGPYSYKAALRLCMASICFLADQSETRRPARSTVAPVAFK